jgi:hypothetical protein
MKNLIFFFLLGICGASFAQRYNAEYKITLKDGRILPVHQQIWKDKDKYIVEGDSGQIWQVERAQILATSDWLMVQPTRKVVSPGILLQQGGNSLIAGTLIGILGTTTALLLPSIAPSTSKYAGYIGLGTGVISLTFSLNGFSKIVKAGKFLDAKKL